MDFIRWARTIRFYRIDGKYVAADRCGWIPGASQTKLGMLIHAIRAYAA